MTAKFTNVGNSYPILRIANKQSLLVSGDQEFKGTQ